MPERHVVSTFVSLVESGRFIEALQRYYHPVVRVWENRQQTRTGLDALIEHEHQVLNAFSVINARAERVMVDGDRVAINWHFEFTNDATHLTLDEVAVQQWVDGKIVHERFYYDPAQLRAEADRVEAHDNVREATAP